MSRIAKVPVTIPSDVTVTVAEGLLTVKGKLGQLTQVISPSVSLTVADDVISFAMNEQFSETKAMVGTIRSLASNMVKGVTEGWSKQLKMVGVGYRAQMAGKLLKLSAGFSHPVELAMAEGIAVETPSATDIVIKGIDKQLVGQQAAIIRSIRPPEPYKGKGIRYVDEVVQLKEGKKK